jgi:hypothetical protein
MPLHFAELVSNTVNNKGTQKHLKAFAKIPQPKQFF